MIIVPLTGVLIRSVAVWHVMVGVYLVVVVRFVFDEGYWGISAGHVSGEHGSGECLIANRETWTKHKLAKVALSMGGETESVSYEC